MEFINLDLNKMSNSEIPKEIFRDSFHLENASSSHWKFFGGLFKVEFAGTDTIKLARGVGFGEFKFTGLKDRILNWFTVFTYLMVVPDKFQILKQFRFLNTLKIPLTYDVFRHFAIVSLLKRRTPPPLDAYC